MHKIIEEYNNLYKKNITDSDLINLGLEYLQKLIKKKYNEQELKTIEWRNNFEIYKKQAEEEFTKRIMDINFIKYYQKYYPWLDIQKTIEKACHLFWATEAGWNHVKKRKTRKINWKLLIQNSLHNKLNWVYNKIDKQEKEIDIGDFTVEQIKNRFGKDSLIYKNCCEIQNELIKKIKEKNNYEETYQAVAFISYKYNKELKDFTINEIKKTLNEIEMGDL